MMIEGERANQQHMATLYREEYNAFMDNAKMFFNDDEIEEMDLQLGRMEKHARRLVASVGNSSVPSDQLDTDVAIVFDAVFDLQNKIASRVDPDQGLQRLEQQRGDEMLQTVIDVIIENAERAAATNEDDGGGATEGESEEQQPSKPAEDVAPAADHIESCVETVRAYARDLADIGFKRDVQSGRTCVRAVGRQLRSSTVRQRRGISAAAAEARVLAEHEAKSFVTRVVDGVLERTRDMSAAAGYEALKFLIGSLAVGGALGGLYYLSYRAVNPRAVIDATKATLERVDTAHQNIRNTAAVAAQAADEAHAIAEDLLKNQLSLGQIFNAVVDTPLDAPQQVADAYRTALLEFLSKPKDINVSTESGANIMEAIIATAKEVRESRTIAELRTVVENWNNNGKAFNGVNVIATTAGLRILSDNVATVRDALDSQQDQLAAVGNEIREARALLQDASNKVHLTTSKSPVMTALMRNVAKMSFLGVPIGEMGALFVQWSMFESVVHMEELLTAFMTDMAAASGFFGYASVAFATMGTLMTGIMLGRINSVWVRFGFSGAAKAFSAAEKGANRLADMFAAYALRTYSFLRPVASAASQLFVAARYLFSSLFTFNRVMERSLSMISPINTTLSAVMVVCSAIGALMTGFLAMGLFAQFTVAALGILWIYVRVVICKLSPVPFIHFIPRFVVKHFGKIAYAPTAIALLMLFVSALSRNSERGLVGAAVQQARSGLDWLYSIKNRQHSVMLTHVEGSVLAYDGHVEALEQLKVTAAHTLRSVMQNVRIESEFARVGGISMLQPAVTVIQE